MAIDRDNVPLVFDDDAHQLITAINKFAVKYSRNDIEIKDVLVEELKRVLGAIYLYCNSEYDIRSARYGADSPVDVFLVSAVGCLSVRVNVDGKEISSCVFERGFTGDAIQKRFLNLLV